MNAQQRESILYLRGEGVSYSKISEKLKISENSVKSFCRRNSRENSSGEKAQRPSGTFCRQCGKRLAQTAGAKQKRFCSDKCRMSWWNSHPEAVNHKIVNQITCMSCGQVFSSYGNRKRKYCSRSCYAQAKAAHK